METVAGVLVGTRRPRGATASGVLGVHSPVGSVTVLAGDVQQWRDGRWRTVLTAAGTPVVDNRKTYGSGFGDYVNDGPTSGQGTMFGFDGSSSGTATFAWMRDGRVHVVDTRADHIHTRWERPR